MSEPEVIEMGKDLEEILSLENKIQQLMELTLNVPAGGLTTIGLEQAAQLLGEDFDEDLGLESIFSGIKTAASKLWDLIVAFLDKMIEFSISTGYKLGSALFKTDAKKAAEIERFERIRGGVHTVYKQRQEEFTEFAKKMTASEFAQSYRAAMKADEFNRLREKLRSEAKVLFLTDRVTLPFDVLKGNLESLMELNAEALHFITTTLTLIGSAVTEVEDGTYNETGLPQFAVMYNEANAKVNHFLAAIRPEARVQLLKTMGTGYKVLESVPSGINSSILLSVVKHRPWRLELNRQPQEVNWTDSRVLIQPHNKSIAEIEEIAEFLYTGKITKDGMLDIPTYNRSLRLEQRVNENTYKQGKKAINVEMNKLRKYKPLVVHKKGLQRVPIYTDSSTGGSVYLDEFPMAIANTFSATTIAYMFKLLQANSQAISNIINAQRDFSRAMSTLVELNYLKIQRIKLFEEAMGLV